MTYKGRSLTRYRTAPAPEISNSRLNRAIHPPIRASARIAGSIEPKTAPERGIRAERRRPVRDRPHTGQPYSAWGIAQTMSEANQPPEVRKRTVRLCHHANHERNASERLWAFSVADLAHLIGVSEQTIKRRITAKQLDPRSLADIARAWAKVTLPDVLAEAIDGAEPFDELSLSASPETAG